MLDRHFLGSLSATILFLIASIAQAAPAQVLIIRHAEKDGGNQLSPAGFQHADQLVQYFETNPDVTQYGTPVAIYAMAPDKAGGVLRPIQTVTPLAQALGLTLNTNYDTNMIPQLVQDVMSNPAYEGKMVLICWVHQQIPALAQQFGAAQAPSSWPGSNVYDLVWELNFSGNQVSSFQQLQQVLQ